VKDRPPGGGAVYAEYVAESLREQDANKHSLESRAMSVISSSATLATLLFGLVAFVPRPAGFQLDVRSASLLAASLGSFALAAVAALVANAPLWYQVPVVAGLRKMIREHWEDSADSALKKVSFNRVKRLQAARQMNRIKAIALVAAIALEALAVVFLALAVTSAVFAPAPR
jgi:hypothetical protein